MVSSFSSSSVPITNYHDIEQRHLVRQKRRTICIIFRILISLLSLVCVGTIIWMFIYLSGQITKFDSDGSELIVSSTQELNFQQTVDQAEWWSFGPRNEKFWRSLLFANLALMLAAIGSCLFAVFLDQYYVMAVVGALAFLESILTVGSQYLTLPYYLASGIFFLFALVLHLYGHFLRLDLIDELILERKRIQNNNDEDQLNGNGPSLDTRIRTTSLQSRNSGNSRAQQQQQTPPQQTRSILRVTPGLY